MDVPREDCKDCVACGKPIVFARENKIRKGQQAIIAIDPEADDGGNYMLSVSGQHYYAGKLGYNQRAGVRSAGQKLHTAHNDTCPKKDEYIRRRIGKWNS